MEAKTYEALMTCADGVKAALEGYIRGESDPGDGLLAQMLPHTAEPVEQILVRWRSAYAEGGVMQIEPTAWVVGLGMLGRTIHWLNVHNISRTNHPGVPQGVGADRVCVVSKQGFAVWISQTYAIESDRYLVTAAMTWLPEPPEPNHVELDEPNHLDAEY